MKTISKEWLFLIVVSVLVVIVGVSEWRKNPPATATNVTSSNNSNNRLEKEEAEVTVIVEYLPDKSTDDMVFQIVLDTHSVDLDAFDFQKDVALEKDNKSSSPVIIDQSGSGHHRQAEVSFERISPPFTIVVMNVSNIPRREFAFNNFN